MDNFNKQMKRNLKGIELEKSGQLGKAIELYEENIRESFIGDHPYNRLAIIYKKQKKEKDQIRVLEKAIWVFDNIVSKGRPDRIVKLRKFEDRLAKIKKA